MRAFLAVVSSLLLASACTAHAPGRPAAPKPNVVLITIDTLRADRIGRGLTPAIDSLAARGTRFTNARASVPLTLPSHTSILTGSLPSENGVRTNGQMLSPRPTIARAFHDAGYGTAAFVSAYVLDRRFGLASNFDVYDDHVDRDPSGAPRLEAERRGDRTMDAALQWLGKNHGEPFFVWIHLYDPHAPYDPPAGYRAKAGDSAYDGEVAFADAQVGRVLDWLRSAAREPRTIVAIAGDHGEGLGDHGETTHGMLAYDSTLRVPLVIAGPRVPVGVQSAPVSLANLAATLLYLSGRDVGPAMQRTSLFAAKLDEDAYAETRYPRTAGWHALAALADERWKVIVSSETELYDVAADPGERHDLAQVRPTIADGMRRRALELAGKSGAAAASAPSSDAVERLRALGYVSAGPSAPDDDRAPNPASRIFAWNAFERELSRVAEGHARAALPGLAQLARAYPDAPVFQSTYARALKDTGRVRDALDIYRKAVARWPDDPALYHDLSIAAAAAGNAAEAARAEQAALALEPANAAAANGLGLLQVQADRPGEAIAWFEKAVAADPTNAVYWTNLGNARRDAGRADMAEQAYRKALELNPASPDAANGIGVLLVQAHRAGEAVQWFERALAGSPSFVEARLNLGIACQESGDAAKAAEQYRRVLDAAPRGSREYQAASALLARVSKQ